VDTIAAIATPPGDGALGIVRLAGPGALTLALRLAGLDALEPRVAARVLLRDARGPIDEGVAVFFPAAKSPLGEDLVELTVHGSAYILERLVSAAVSTGAARRAQPGEFTQRAFLNGKLDLAQAEAVCGLVRARSEAAHQAALRQLRGGLSQAVRRCREPIFDLLVRVEACLDHPEEDIPSLTPAQAGAAVAAARAPIDALAASYRLGRLASEGARVALVGRPNAGKSSLFNALLGRERAIVRPEPGTTRDTIEEDLELAGRRVTLVDTAGLRAAADPAEREGVRRAAQALESCDAAVLVIDGSRAPDAEDGLEHAAVAETARRRGLPLVRAFNKSDLGGRLDGPIADPAVALSAATGAGVGELRGLLARALGPSPDESREVVTSDRHHAALQRASCELAAAEECVRALAGGWEDRAAFHLRQAAGALGDILGEDAGEQALHAVFSRFCVGK